MCENFQRLLREQTNRETETSKLYKDYPMFNQAD